MIVYIHPPLSVTTDDGQTLDIGGLPPDPFQIFHLEIQILTPNFLLLQEELVGVCNTHDICQIGKYGPHILVVIGVSYILFYLAAMDLLP